MTLSADELLAGGKITYEISLPPDLLSETDKAPANGFVVLRPLTILDLQRISKAAQNNQQLSASLMIQQALVEPALRHEQVAQLPAGIAKFLVDKINDISGINTPQNALEELVQAPLARACFILAKEFGWTPEEVSGMTIGQILLYLEMASRDGE